MKYGLDKETTVVKEFKELSGPQVKIFKRGLLIHPDIYWMGSSPDGVIYDPNENPSVAILEIKSLFSMKGKSVCNTLLFALKTSFPCVPHARALTTTRSIP